MLKRPSSKAAASEEVRRTLRYVEPLSKARTMLGDFFIILLVLVRFRTRTARSFQGVLFNQGERSFESIDRRGRGRWCKSITVPPLSAGSDSAQMPLSWNVKRES